MQIGVAAANKLEAQEPEENLHSGRAALLADDSDDDADGNGGVCANNGVHSRHTAYLPTVAVTIYVDTRSRATPNMDLYDYSHTSRR